MSALRLTADDKEELIDLADHILSCWRGYSDPSAEVLAETAGEKHNTITPIARRRGDLYEFDLVLRNNRTTAEHPMGLFHPHAEVHHIKKENIGLIEVLGLAILPARLKQELAQIKDMLLRGETDISGLEEIKKHAAWYLELRSKCSEVEPDAIDALLRREVGHKFEQVLTHAGVFKRTEKGLQAFDAFVEGLSLAKAKKYKEVGWT
jgi:Galactose-1-phosphate uridyltransferase